MPLIALATSQLPNQRQGFEVPDEKLNPNGGAVAIGHPFGSSGTRYVLTLATELSERGARYGVLGVCVGSGQGVALVLENPPALRGGPPRVRSDRFKRAAATVGD